jgi:hypothetical protein
VKGEHQREFVIGEKVLDKMLKHEKCTPVLKDLIPFLIDTGLRLGEAMSLEWMSVDIKHDPGSVFVERGKTKNPRCRLREILLSRKPPVLYSFHEGLNRLNYKHILTCLGRFLALLFSHIAGSGHDRKSRSIVLLSLLSKCIQCLSILARMMFVWQTTPTSLNRFNARLWCSWQASANSQAMSTA